MSIPDSIKRYQPARFGAVETRSIGVYYYVYLISSRWDAAKGRPQKATGKICGGTNCAGTLWKVLKRNAKKQSTLPWMS